MVCEPPIANSVICDIILSRFTYRSVMKGTMVLLALAVILSACRTDDVMTYHSHAFMKRNVRAVRTKMILQKCLNDYRESNGFGVVAALDKDVSANEKRYLLIAPRDNQKVRSNNLGDYQVSRAAVLLLDDVAQLADALRSIVSTWDMERTDREGVFWEYSSSPSATELNLNDSVVVTSPTLQIFGSSLEGGVGIILRIAEKNNVYMIPMDDKETVKCFIEALERASKAATSMTID
jgi:hypothetical protein